MCALLHLHTYAGDTLKVWPKLISSIDLMGRLIMYALDIYNFHTSKFLQTYYHNIPLLVMKSSPPRLSIGECLKAALASSQIAFPYSVASGIQ